MIAPFVEGLQQSLLPCSWVVVVPAVLIGVVSRSWRMPAVFGATVVLGTWASISGWLNPPLWLAGAVLVGGAAAMWRFGSNLVSAAAVGAGAAWAWQPCVGEELATVLNTAQRDPIGAFPGLVGFMLGLVVAGLAIGFGIQWLMRRFSGQKPEKPTAVVFGLLGLLMITGLYSSVASVFARWSTEIWG